MAHEQVGLERIGMIVVEGRAFFEPQIVSFPIIPVVLQNGDVVFAERIDVRRTTVVLPEPDPPATPMTIGGTRIL